MKSPDQHADPPVLMVFADKAAALPPEAWNRIGERCALLDPSTVTAFLGRVELIARSVTPDPDPYAQPLVQSTMAVMGNIWGMMLEVSARLAPLGPEYFERARPRGDQGSTVGRVAGMDAFLRIQGLAQRQQAVHPGTAAALRAVSLALMVRRTPAHATFEAVYRPFEPEIPYASLSPSPGEHAA
jgi:hypothetical protein